MKNNNVIIRPEKTADLDIIYHFTKIAFSTAKLSDGTEQDFANSLRESSNYLPDLALVAELGSNIIGHIMLTRTEIIDADGKHYQTLLLGPIAVKLGYRDQGIGSMLIQASLTRAKALGYTSVFLFGDPNYYVHFGFKPVSQFNVESSTNIPAPYVMGLELTDGSLNGISGKLVIHAIFDLSELNCLANVLGTTSAVLRISVLYLNLHAALLRKPNV